MTKKIIFLIILSLVLTSCGAKEKKVKIHKNYKISEVSTWVVNVSDNFIWYTKWVNQAMLATKTPWRITYLKKKIWDKVFAWELIASLDSQEAKSWYNTANKIIANLIKIKEKTSKALDEQIKAMQAKKKSVEAQVDWVSIWFEDTKKITQSQLETAEKWLETAKLNLEETKKELDNKKENILTWAKSSLTYSIILATNSIDFLKNLFWMDQNNDEYYNKIKFYLWAKNTNQLRQTRDLYRKINPLYIEYKKYYEEKIENKNPDEEILLEWLNKAKILLNEIKKILNESYKVLNNSIENVYFPIATINSLKQQIILLGENIEKTILSTDWWLMLGIDWSLENLKNFETNKNKALSLLEKQVELAEKKVAQYKAMAAWQVNNVETKKKIANLWLLEINSGIEALKAKKQATLSEINAKIAEAIWKKDQSSIMINNWNIIAPFSWIVTNKMSEKWQITNAWMPIYEIADNSKILLKVSVPASIISKLRKWDKLDVIIESKNKTFTWIISNIWASANPITKKYKVEITLDNKKWIIPVWAMAIVSFNTDFISWEKKKINSLRIPNKAIVEKFMVPWVYILDWKRVIFKKIKIKKMWEYFSEVEWLKAWEKVITDWKENIYDWEILN